MGKRETCVAQFSLFHPHVTRSEHLKDFWSFYLRTCNPMKIYDFKLCEKFKHNGRQKRNNFESLYVESYVVDLLYPQKSYS